MPSQSAGYDHFSKQSIATNKMKNTSKSIKFLGLFLGLLLLISALYIISTRTNSASLDTGVSADSNISADSIYQFKTPPSPDGIGKIYMGREIAQVMGHQGAGWLERNSREAEENPNQLITELELKPTDIIADIGAGTGYFSFKIATLLPSSKVVAVDIQPEMIEILELLKQEKKISNVEARLGTVSNPNLPESSIDMALMVDAYHEFDHPREMLQNIAKALKPNGRVVLAEYKGENPFVAIKRLHKMTQKQVKKEMTAIGLTWQKTKDNLPQQHLMIFQKLST